MPPSSFSPSPFSCLFPSTSQSVGCSPHWLLSFSPVKMHHNPSQLTPIYSSTGVFSSSYPNMLWRCFSFPALSEYSARSVYRFIPPLPQDWKSIVVRGKAPLDPPYLPPSGQGSLSQLRTGKRERESEERNSDGCLFHLHALTWGQQLLTTSLKRDTSAMGQGYPQYVCVGDCARPCVFSMVFVVFKSPPGRHLSLFIFLPSLSHIGFLRMIKLCKSDYTLKVNECLRVSICNREGGVLPSC